MALAHQAPEAVPEPYRREGQAAQVRTLRYRRPGFFAAPAGTMRCVGRWSTRLASTATKPHTRWQGAQDLRGSKRCQVPW